jgi:hypothetical protein
LVFCSYPQLIRELFNVQPFGPPRVVTPASPWPWIDHLFSGLVHTTRVAHFALAFASASGHKPLTSPHATTPGLMQKARGKAFPLRGIAPPLLVSAWFQVSFTPLTGVLFIVRSRYSFAIGRQVVFSLASWSTQIRAGYHVTRPTWETTRRGTRVFA